METTHSFDETPTPTRFIRNCEDMGLFQDLQLNPFDETFRIAVESSTSDLSNVLRESLAKPATEETLNTPKLIAVKSDNFQHLYNIMEDDDSGGFIISPDHFLVDSVDSESTGVENKDNISVDSEEVEIIEEPIQQQNGFVRRLEVSPPASVNAIVTALASSNSNTIAYTINGDAIKNGTIGNIIIQAAPPITSKCNSINNNNQPLRTQPLVLPKPVIATTTTDGSKEAPKFITSKNVVILPSRNYNITKPSTSQPIRPAVIKDEHMVQEIDEDVDVKENMRNFIAGSSSHFVDEPMRREGRKRSMTESSCSTIPGVDEKREYSRERNRLAQKRCRMKKKKSIMQMQKDTQIVFNENQSLQNEVGNLRAEVAHLKTLLLAHRNCSVTRAMFKADLSAILNNDISDIAENVEIPVPDSTNDCEETTISYSSIVSHQQLNQVNHHVSHIHVHVPPEEALESSLGARSRSVQQPEVRQHTQRKLIFDSKVVPIKPDERSASVLHHKPISSSTARSKAIEAADDRKLQQQPRAVAAADSASRATVDDSKPMQSTEVSRSRQWLRRMVYDPVVRVINLRN